jgi:hypothetical protein
MGIKSEVLNFGDFVLILKAIDYFKEDYMPLKYKGLLLE